MKWIDNAGKAWRFYSMQFAFVGLCAEGALIANPALVQWLGDRNLHHIAFFIFAGAMVGRMVDQRKPDGK